MLKNYFEIDENETVNSFLKEVKEKKNSQYIILKTKPKTFIDIRTIALKKHDMHEKLKNLKRPLAECNGNNRDDFLNFLIESGERVINTPHGYYDFIDSLKDIKNHDFDFLNEKLTKTMRREIFALNEKDKISDAKAIFVKHKTNLLPIIEKRKIVGELRPIDLLVTDLVDTKKSKKDKYDSSREDMPLNLPVSNIVNKKPITIENTKTYKDAIEIMIKKKLPALIVTQKEDIFSVVSYKDIFKLVRKSQENPKYVIEYIGKENVYGDEFKLIQEYANKTMKRITKRLNKDNVIYDTLKIVLKSHGNTQGTHLKKIETNISISKGNKSISVSNQISQINVKEGRAQKPKTKWNPALLVQNTLKTLENKVFGQKRRK